MKEGILHVSDGTCPPQLMKLILTDDLLVLQKEEMVCVSPGEEATLDNSKLNKERQVTVRREKEGGLGLSVKGGAEHNLPILISRIFKDQAADKTHQLFVGDAILMVNGTSVENASHDQAVALLKSAGDVVTLAVKYFRPASLFLNKNNRKSENGNDADNQNKRSSRYDEQNNIKEPRAEKHWCDFITIPLLCAFLSRYEPNSDKLRSSSLEVSNMEGTNSVVLHCDDLQSLDEWLQALCTAIAAHNSKTILSSNRCFLPSQQIVYMGWASERISPTKHWASWHPQGFALKGPEVCMFSTPPVKAADWEKSDKSYKIYECMLRVLKDTELQDGRQHCFSVQHGSGSSHYMSVDTRQDLLRIEKAWYRANFKAVTHLQNRTFGCTWRGRLSGLTLDLSVGFSLYDGETKSFMWSYKFSQLKSSSDDGRTKLTLVFQSSQEGETETRELECTHLQTLLFAMHAFLSAKLAGVDPAFLQNL